MCLDTATKLDPQQEGIGYKCFQTDPGGGLRTMLNYFPVERGKWITNPDAGGMIRSWGVEYFSGFHILENCDEVLLYLGHEYSMHNYPWHISAHRFEIFPVKYKAAHTRGTQYGFKVIVADEIYILTDDELQEFTLTRSYEGRPFTK